MRASLLVLTLFVSTITVAQSTLDTQLSKDFCNCFSEIHTPSFPDVEKCFSKALQIHQDSAIVAIKSEYGDISKESVNKFLQALIGKTTVSFIHSCDAYFKYMDTSRNSIYQNVNKDSVRKAIISIRNKSSETNDTFFIKRGEMYFEISDLKKALSDFNYALKLDSNSIVAYYFKAWVLERNGNYAEAYDICNKLTQLSDNIKYKILTAILSRKKDGL